MRMNFYVNSNLTVVHITHHTSNNFTQRTHRSPYHFHRIKGTKSYHCCCYFCRRLVFVFIHCPWSCVHISREKKTTKTQMIAECSCHHHSKAVFFLMRACARFLNENNNIHWECRNVMVHIHIHPHLMA